MVKFCAQDRAALKKVETINPSTETLKMTTLFGVKEYEAYECTHCGQLTFFRKEEHEVAAVTL